MSLQPNSKPIFSLWLLIVVNYVVSALFCAVFYVVLSVNVVDILLIVQHLGQQSLFLLVLYK